MSFLGRCGTKPSWQWHLGCACTSLNNMTNFSWQLQVARCSSYGLHCRTRWVTYFVSWTLSLVPTGSSSPQHLMQIKNEQRDFLGRSGKDNVPVVQNSTVCDHRIPGCGGLISTWPCWAELPIDITWKVCLKEIAWGEAWKHFQSSVTRFMYIWEVYECIENRRFEGFAFCCIWFVHSLQTWFTATYCTGRF